MSEESLVQGQNISLKANYETSRHRIQRFIQAITRVPSYGSVNEEMLFAAVVGERIQHYNGRLAGSLYLKSIIAAAKESTNPSYEEAAKKALRILIALVSMRSDN